MENKRILALEQRLLAKYPRWPQQKARWMALQMFGEIQGRGKW